MNTSEGAWVEEGEDTKRIGKSPVMSIEDYGDGELILISDPSIMINSMIDKLDNGVIVSNLLNYISEDRTDIIIDESHRKIRSFLERNIEYGIPRESRRGIQPIQKLVTGTEVIC